MKRLLLQMISSFLTSTQLGSGNVSAFKVVVDSLALTCEIIVLMSSKGVGLRIEQNSHLLIACCIVDRSQSFRILHILMKPNLDWARKGACIVNFDLTAGNVCMYALNLNDVGI